MCSSTYKRSAGVPGRAMPAPRGGLDRSRRCRWLCPVSLLRPLDRSQRLGSSVELRRCDYLLHGSSAVAEAAIYINPLLHWHSTHLEYEEVCQTTKGTARPQEQHTLRRASPSSVCFDAPWRWDYSEAAKRLAFSARRSATDSDCAAPHGEL